MPGCVGEELAELVVVHAGDVNATADAMEAYFQFCVAATKTDRLRKSP